MRIVRDDLTGPEIAALLALHLAGMRALSPPESVHALDLDRLRTPDIAFWTAWDGDALMGCAALREIDPRWGEVKSMRTAPDHVRKGVARSLLDHIVGEARDRGYRRLSLETGSGPDFAAPLALYARAGFVGGAVFAPYAPDPFLRFLHLEL